MQSSDPRATQPASPVSSASGWSEYVPPNAIPNLKGRPRLKRQGLARPAYALYFFVDLAIFAFIGYLCSLALRALESGDFGNHPRSSMLFRILLPLVFYLLGNVYLIFSFDKFQVRRCWLILFLDVLFAHVFTLGCAAHWLPGLIDSAVQGDFRAISMIVLIILAPWSLLFSTWQITIHDGFRVHYNIDGGKWADRHCAYFKSIKAHDVLEALGRGDANTLAALRKPPPSAASHGWQNFTVLTLSTCPGHPEQPAYLHLKDVWIGGGPLATTRTHSTLGLSQLHHVQLLPEDVTRLYNLIPDMFDTWTDGRPEYLPASSVSTGVAFASMKPVGPPNSDTPLGLPVGSPSVLESEDGFEFIRALPISERARIRFWGTLGVKATLLAVGTLFLGAFIMAWAMTVISSTEYHRLEGALSIAFLSFIAILFGVALFHRQIRNRIFAKILSNRSCRLFGSDEIDTLVFVHEMQTLQKSIILADDVALVRMRPGVLELELSNAQVRLRGERIKIDIYTPDKGLNAGNPYLRLSTEILGYPWEICLKRQPEESFLAGFSSEQSRAEKLWRDIYHGLTGTQPPVAK